MKKVVRIVSLLVAVLMLSASLLTGCGDKETAGESTTSTASAASTQVAQDASKPDTSEEAELKMVLLGDKPNAYDQVYGELNKLMKQDINATVSVDFISWGDVDKKYPLLFAAGESLDMIYTANWNKYNQYASSGAFLELTEDMIKKAAPLTWEKENPGAWDQAKVNGKIYMVPCDGADWSPYKVMAIRGDLREKYSLSEVKTVEDLEKYYDAVVKNEKGLFPYAASNTNYELQNVLLEAPNAWKEINGTGEHSGLMFKYTDDQSVPFFMYDTPEFMTYANKIRDWSNKGYWSKNAFANKTAVKDSWGNGTSASHSAHISSIVSDSGALIDKNPSAKVEVVDLNPGVKKMASLYIQNGISIAASSKNAERSLMLLDLLRYNKAYFDLTWYGIKDVHYQEVDGKIKSLPAASDFPFKNVCPWAWKSPLELDAYDDNAIKAKLNETKTTLEKTWTSSDLVTPKAQNFNFDNTNVKNELAAISNILATDGLALQLGMVDPAKAVPELMEKCKKAGLEKVMTELKSQMQAFLTK